MFVRQHVIKAIAIGSTEMAFLPRVITSSDRFASWMVFRMRWALSLMCASILAWSPNAKADTKTLQALDREVWSRGALFCGIELPTNDVAPVYKECPYGIACFPGEGRESPSGPQCGDGDMTFFNSLLCLAGINAGCEAVAAAQNLVTGQWYRSPRLRAYPRLRPTNTFSPDMALGVLLWSALRPEAGRKQMQYWVDWLGRVQRCANEGCTVRVPRFCPDDDIDGDAGAEYGCTLRPGDAATLGLVIKKLGVNIRDQNLKAWINKWSNQSIDLLISSALLNKPGYSQHLVGVNILVHWKFGVHDVRLDQAANLLAEKQPRNPFFAWLAGASPRLIENLVIARCPSNIESLPPQDQRRDWTWQREDNSDAWKRMMVWDCRFISAILVNEISAKGVNK